MNTRRIMSWVGVAAGLVAIGGPVHANESNLPANSYGNVGLMQTPTARFTPAGSLRVGFASARLLRGTASRAFKAWRPGTEALNHPETMGPDAPREAQS